MSPSDVCPSVEGVSNKLSLWLTLGRVFAVFLYECPTKIDTNLQAVTSMSVDDA